MSEVELDLLFNYDITVGDLDQGGPRADMKSRNVEANQVYLDHSSMGILLGVRTGNQSMSIDIPDHEIESVIEQLEQMKEEREP